MPTPTLVRPSISVFPQLRVLDGFYSFLCYDFSDQIVSKRRISPNELDRLVFVLAIASILVPVRTEHLVGYEVAHAAPSNDLALNREIELMR